MYEALQTYIIYVLYYIYIIYVILAAFWIRWIWDKFTHEETVLTWYKESSTNTWKRFDDFDMGRPRLNSEKNTIF